MSFFKLQNLQFSKYWQIILKLFESVEDVGLNQELNKDEFETNFLHCLLKSSIRKNYIIAVAVNKKNILVLNLGVTSSNASVLEILSFGPVVELDLSHSIFLVLPLRWNQTEDLLVVRLWLRLRRRHLFLLKGGRLAVEHFNIG